MVIFGRWGAGKDFADEVDYSIATSSKFSNNFEFASGVLMVCDGRLLEKMDWGEAKDFTQEGNSLADEVTGRQNILYMRGNGRASLVGGRAGGTGDGLGE